MRVGETYLGPQRLQSRDADPRRPLGDVIAASHTLTDLLNNGYVFYHYAMSVLLARGIDPLAASMLPQDIISQLYVLRADKPFFRFPRTADTDGFVTQAECTLYASPEPVFAEHVRPRISRAAYFSATQDGTATEFQVIDSFFVRVPDRAFEAGRPGATRIPKIAAQVFLPRTSSLQFSLVNIDPVPEFRVVSAVKTLEVPDPLKSL